MDAKTLAELLKKYPNTAIGEDGMTVISCVARLAFVHFDKPHKQKDSNKDERYSCAVIIPAEADITPLKNAQRIAWEKSTFAASRDAPKAIALKPQSSMTKAGGKKRDYEGFSSEGVFFNAETKNPVDLFNIDMTPAAVDKFYSGCWARVKIRAQAFDVSGNYGVKFWLQAAQFFHDDEEFKSVDSSDGFEAASAPAGTGPARVPNGATSLF